MSIAWGRPGVEVPHVINGLYLNVRHPPSGARYVIDRIGGFYSLPEIEDQRRSGGSARGEVALPVYPRGKTLTYEGRIDARSLPDWRAAYRNLANAVRGRNSEATVVLDGETQWAYSARVLQLDADEDPVNLDPHKPWPWTGGFQLGLRMSDARFYVVPAVEHHSGDGSVLTNMGSTDTDAVFVLSHPSGGDLSITNNAIGKALVFTDLDPGNYTLTFGNRRGFSSPGGGDQSGHLDVDSSSWWDELVPCLIPGDNTIAVTGVSSWVAYYSHADE